MPSVNVAISPAGPLIVLQIGISIPHRRALELIGAPIPPYQNATLLIDTGASGTCIDPRILTPLGLTPTGTIDMQTPSTNGVPVTCNQFDISLFIGIPGGAPFMVEALAVIETQLAGQGIDGLLGRDVLDRCTMVYNGSLKVLTLAY